MGADTLLLGPASADRYLDDGRVLPGGGALNMAYHWACAGVPFRLVTRIGEDGREVFGRFLARHGIETTDDLVAPGVSSSIDITIGADRQPHMDNFVEGVWSDFRLTAAEEATLSTARRLHAALVAPAVAEVLRLGGEGRLAHLDASGDFLSFRRWTVERFDAVMAHLGTGIVGWPGAVDDPLLDGLRAVAHERGRLVVVTLGDRGVRVFDGRDGRGAERYVPVDAVEVRGTTVGCGDSFIAAFLAASWAGRGLDGALDAARVAGAAATAWRLPLPDEAYE